MLGSDRLLQCLTLCRNKMSQLSMRRPGAKSSSCPESSDTSRALSAADVSMRPPRLDISDWILAMLLNYLHL